jgi:hypothetical protein
MGAMRLGREQFVSSTVDTNSSVTSYSQKLQSKPRKQVQFNDEPTYIPPTNFIRVDEYEGPIGTVIADEEMINNLNPQLEHERPSEDTIHEWFTEAHNGMIGHVGCSSTVQRIRPKGHNSWRRMHHDIHRLIRQCALYLFNYLVFLT